MYEIGQKIRIIEENPDGNSQIHIGDTGIIKWVYDPHEGNYVVAVEFDNKINGWDCDGKCEYGYGWKLHCDEFEAYEDDKNMTLSETDIDEFLGF